MCVYDTFPLDSLKQPQQRHSRENNTKTKEDEIVKKTKVITDVVRVSAPIRLTSANMASAKQEFVVTSSQKEEKGKQN